VSDHFLESCDIKKNTFYSTSISIQFSETSLNCTNQSIRGERSPPIRAYAEAGVIGEQVASKWGK